MSEFDLVLKNGTVFFPSGRENTDIGIKEDKIIFIGNIVNSDKSLDCSNLYIFPGLIDTPLNFFINLKSLIILGTKSNLPAETAPDVIIISVPIFIFFFISFLNLFSSLSRNIFFSLKYIGKFFK